MIIKRLIYFVALLSAMVACNRIEDNSILSAPSDLKAVQIGLESIRLTWTNDSKSYDGVIVERASQEGGWEFSEIGRAPEGNLYFDDNRHSGEAFYQYRLTTYRRDKTGASAYVTYRYSKLPAPTDFKGELTDEGYVLTWTDNCAGEDGYVVLRGRDDEVLAEWKVLGREVSLPPSHSQSGRTDRVILGSSIRPMVNSFERVRSSSCTPASCGTPTLP